MNRYQEQVIEMDRRRAIAVRLCSFAGASVLIVVALWSAGLPPSIWFERARTWMAAGSAQRVLPAETPVSPTPVRNPATHVEAPAPSTQGLPGTVSSIAATPQPLMLISTVPGRNPREGIAAMGVDPENPQVYGAGALLANGARLVEIHKDYAVLERGGETGRLYLSTHKERQTSDSPLILVGGPQEAPAVAAPMREVITDYLRPSPVYDGERLRGYEVYPGARSGVFAQLGLQAGDVITAIDGVPLNEPVSALEIFRQLTNGVSMIATVDRNGKAERIALDGALIAEDKEGARMAESTRGESVAAALSGTYERTTTKRTE